LLCHKLQRLHKRKLLNGDATGAFSVAINATQGKHLRYSINAVRATKTQIFYRFSSRNLHCYFARCKGCTTTDTITIGQPDPIVLQEQCTYYLWNRWTQRVYNNQTVTGGTAPYNYFVTGVNGMIKNFNQTGTTSVFNV
jgi:hypothetical protein